jgi:hypothetical protein
MATMPQPAPDERPQQALAPLPARASLVRAQHVRGETMLMAAIGASLLGPFILAAVAALRVLRRVSNHH